MKKFITPGLLLAATLLIFGAAARFFTPLPNFTPIAAIALFGGTYFNKKKLALLLPLLILAVTDAIIGIYAPVTMAAVYLSFIFTGIIGIVLSKKITKINVIGATLLSSVTFFLVTNFAAWISGFCGYPMTFSGLIYCYEMGLPFFRNDLLATLLYSGILFGTFELVKSKYKIFANI
ncbi:MAG: hypothetical protein LBC89_01670 [Bacteroidales bacterium]|jgi:hypothetical protein|nr:hypothetical protein [Bacteroidales bacterium]